MDVFKTRLVIHDRLTVLGTAFTSVDMHAAVEQILEWAGKEATNAKQVCVSGVHGVIEAEHDASFREILNTADLNVADGVPIVWLGRLSGTNGIGRVFGPDLMLEVCKHSIARKYSHFFYGGNEGVADALAEAMHGLYPGIRIAGTYCPPFRVLTDEEQATIINVINSARPDILWVGLSTPKQERWIAAMKSRLNVGVVLGVGAAFDYNTGKIKRAPRWAQSAGLEWLFRLLQEPRRLYRRYLINNPKFLLLLAGQLFGLRKVG